MPFTTPLLWRYYATAVAFLCHYCDVTLAVQETELEAADAARAAAHNAQLEAEAAVDDVHATLAAREQRFTEREAAAEEAAAAAAAALQQERDRLAAAARVQSPQLEALAMQARAGGAVIVTSRRNVIVTS